MSKWRIWADALPSLVTCGFIGFYGVNEGRLWIVALASFTLGFLISNSLVIHIMENKR